MYWCVFFFLCVFYFYFRYPAICAYVHFQITGFGNQETSSISRCEYCTVLFCPCSQYSCTATNVQSVQKIAGSKSIRKGFPGCTKRMPAIRSKTCKQHRPTYLPIRYLALALFGRSLTGTYNAYMHVMLFFSPRLPCLLTASNVVGFAWR